MLFRWIVENSREKNFIKRFIWISKKELCDTYIFKDEFRTLSKICLYINELLKIQQRKKAILKKLKMSYMIHILNEFEKRFKEWTLSKMFVFMNC